MSAMSQQPAASSKLSPVFSFGSDSPADLLSNAAAVCHFLSEVAGAISTDGGRHPGLSETGSFGLICILDGIEATINEAASRL